MVWLLIDRLCDLMLTLPACAACCPHHLKIWLNMFEIAS